MFDAMFPSHWSRIRKLYWLNKLKNNVATYDVVVGNPVSFSAKAAPLRQLKVAFSPVQSGSGDPSPDNVRPISGWSSLAVEQSGKNLLSPETFSDYQSYTVNADGSITITGGNSTAWSSDQNIPVFLKAGTYVFSRTNTTGRAAMRSSLNNYGSDLAAVNNGAASVSFTLESDAYIKIKLNSGTDIYPLTSFFQIELGTTATEYVPYNPSSRSISISLGQTVYSGYVDVISGVGEITGVVFVVDETGSGMYPSPRSTAAGGVYFSRNVTTMCPYSAVQIELAQRDEKYSHGKIDNPYSKVGDFAWVYKVSATATALRIGFTDPSIATVDDLKAFVAENGNLEIYYPIETPIPIQLTPQEVKSLLGENVMFTPCDSLTVTYRSN